MTYPPQQPPQYQQYPQQPPAQPYGQPYGQVPPQPGAGYGYPQGAPQGYAMQPPPLAGWWSRVAATLLDSLIVGLIPIVCMVAGIGMVVMSFLDCADDDNYPYGSTTTCEPSSGAIGGGMALIVIGGILGFALGMWLIHRQGKTGQTPGKKMMNISVVRERDGQPTGFGMAFVRNLAHFVDSICFNLGYLWPLWDDKKQTFADKMVGTVVIRTR
ncbi:RDD family protein [Streptomyces sp. ISL-11]|uniref:RDD family protein n=1 Tax=Streptomyces sp. ISL-11 TaxID=2819174 RepID=UPI001BEC77B2|nr:RDD family protein [Streptomyces sp. ISL-11]MBT2387573.1 RDD family protein [Streptomyces sp. ISL-11]